MPQNAKFTCTLFALEALFDYLHARTIHQTPWTQTWQTHCVSCDVTGEMNINKSDCYVLHNNSFMKVINIMVYSKLQQDIYKPVKIKLSVSFT